MSTESSAVLRIIVLCNNEVEDDSHQNSIKAQLSLTVPWRDTEIVGNLWKQLQENFALHQSIM